MLPHETRLKLSDWFDDLSVRFLVNLPDEELQDASRICFQIEEAHWFYEDFVREESPDLPSMNMRQFAYEIMAHCPLLETWPEDLRVSAFEAFIAYKARVPVRGGILLNHDMTEVVLVKGWKKSAKWSFPRGKLNKEEHDLVCAVREVYEETGYDLKQAGLVAPEEDMKSIQVPIREQDIKLFVFRGVPKDTYFAPRTRKEISDIQWYKLSDLPTQKRKNAMQQTQAQQNAAQDKRGNSFYMVAPFLGPLKAWI
ncbi:DCP2-domain-containing protein, partial [Sporormia fimetaria CBS 119925]